MKRAVLVWPRRHGKDKTALNFTIREMFRRVGTYFHFFPTYAQGKKILWDGMGKDSFPFLSHFPPPIIAARNETELQITTINGSIWQVVGTDKIDSVVGTNPVGCVFSEYALQDPRAWKLVSPILRENDGWAVFCYTPRGHNHGKELYDMARQNPEWFCQRLTARDCRRDDGRQVITDEDIEAERHAGMDEALLQQEYFCSFEGYMEGSYYAKQLQKAEDDGRITDVPHRPNLPVFTCWDLGIGDAAAIWFVQRVGDRLNVIDYYETSGEGIPYYAKLLMARPYSYSRHYWPHDGRHREFGTGQTRREVGETLGIRPIDIVRVGLVEEGIERARNLLSRCWFDRQKCEQGLSALASYHKERDEDRKEFKNKPFHDWSSHGADAFRTLAMSDIETVSMGYGDPVRVQTAFDPHAIPGVVDPVTVLSQFEP